MNYQSKEMLLKLLDFNAQLRAFDPQIMETIDFFNSSGFDEDTGKAILESIKSIILSSPLNMEKLNFIKNAVERFNIQDFQFMSSFAEALYLDTSHTDLFLDLIQRNHLFPSEGDEYEYFRILTTRLSKEGNTELLEAFRAKILAL